MATVSLAPATAALDQPHAAGPAWWRHWHSYSLPVVVTAEIAATWLVVKLAEGGPWPSPWDNYLVSAMLGFVMAQCFLLAIWAALGGLATVPRWLCVGTVYVAGASALTIAAFEPTWQSILDNAPEVVLLGGILMAALAAILLPLRRLAGWRIDFDAAYHPQPAQRRGQLALMDFAAMFCAVALPLTLCRILIESEIEDASDMLVFLGVFALVELVTAAPVAWAAMARRRSLAWLAAAAVWVCVVSFGQSWLASALPDLDLFGTSPGFAGMHWEVLMFHGGTGAAIALPLLALRLCGLKLLVLAGR
jgi:hypothetical protein